MKDFKKSLAEQCGLDKEENQKFDFLMESIYKEALKSDVNPSLAKVLPSSTLLDPQKRFQERYSYDQLAEIRRMFKHFMKIKEELEATPPLSSQNLEFYDPYQQSFNQKFENTQYSLAQYFFAIKAFLLNMSVSSKSQISDEQLENLVMKWIQLTKHERAVYLIYEGISLKNEIESLYKSQWLKKEFLKVKSNMAKGVDYEPLKQHILSQSTKHF